ncbi:type IV pilin protein, partial [Simonsiella muelleri]
MKYSARSSRGFTLVELMVTVAIVAILAAIAYPSYIDYIYRSRLEQARVVVMDNVKMMERYYGLSRSFECKAD